MEAVLFFKRHTMDHIMMNPSAVENRSSAPGEKQICVKWRIVSTDRLSTLGSPLLFWAAPQIMETLF